jgi:DNA-binding NtrC family response regulator
MRIAVFDPTLKELQPLAKELRRASDATVDLIATPALLEGEVAEGRADLVLLDARTGGPILARLRRRDGHLPIVMTAADGDVGSAQSAIAAGATDFLVRGDRLADRVRTLLQKLAPILLLVQDNRTLRTHLAETHQTPLVYASDAMKRVVRQAEAVAQIPRPVLLLGERGTGKEVIATHIHATSGAGRPFVAVNCAAFADSLLESELFGHEKGAFTGADRRVTGRFEQAHGGTLFLDEIGHMSLHCQSSILRVVEHGAVRRVGSTQDVQVDVRIVAATNADLAERMEDGTFLRDLYDRLAFEVIEIPPLRDRPGDIAVLAVSFLERFCVEVLAGSEKVLTPAALKALGGYPFPGNVRELKSIVERAGFHDRDGKVDVDDLALRPAKRRRAGSFQDQVEAFERSLLEDALKVAGGNGAAAARALGLSYHQLRYFAKKHGL